MLKKCLKYDLKSMLGYWLLGAISVLALSFPVGLTVRSLIENINKPNHFPWEILVIIAFVFAVVGFAILTEVLVYVRFYKHFFSDEGYLTFTLPVKRRILYTSKVINALIWSILTAIVIIFSICVIISFIPTGEPTPTPPVVEDDIPWLWILLYILEGLAIMFVSTLLGIVSMYLIITIGGTIVRKHKIIATIGIGYGAYLAISILSYIFTIFFTMYFLSALILFSGPTNMLLLIFFALALVIVVMVSLTIALALFNLKLIERKLNLA